MIGSKTSAPSKHDQVLITERVLETIEEIFSPQRKEKSMEKLLMVIGILEKVILPTRLEALRKCATEPSNILKVAMHLSAAEMKTNNGHDRLATRLKELIRMDGQYVTKEETMDSIIQLMEIHKLFTKKTTDTEEKKVRFC